MHHIICICITSLSSNFWFLSNIYYFFPLVNAAQKVDFLATVFTVFYCYFLFLLYMEPPLWGTRRLKYVGDSHENFAVAIFF